MAEVGGRSGRNLALAGLALAFLLSAPLAADSAPVLENRVRLEGIELQLNGAGYRNFLFLDIYQVALYLPRRLDDPRAVLGDEMPRRVRIALLRDISAERDAELLLSGLEDNNTPVELAAIRPQLEHFLALIRALGTVPRGSVVLLDYLPRVGTRVWLNQRLLETVPGAAFNRAVLKIWLGEQPIQENLKKALLGREREAI
jgi:hypothetical protein